MVALTSSSKVTSFAFQFGFLSSSRKQSQLYAQEPQGQEQRSGRTAGRSLQCGLWERSSQSSQAGAACAVQMCLPTAESTSGREGCSCAACSASQALLRTPVLEHGEALQENPTGARCVCLLALNCTSSFAPERAGTTH